MPMGLRRFVLPAVAVAVLAAAGASRAVVATPTTEPVAATPQNVTPVSTGDRAVFVPVPQKRLLNTLSGARLATAGTRSVQVAGVAGVPPEALAVVLNVAAYQPAKGGYLIVYPAGAGRPSVRTVNYVVGQVAENVTTVKVGTGGKVSVYSSYTTHAMLDIAGYYIDHAHDDRYLLKAQAQARSAENAFLCPAGTLIRSVAADGAPTCVVDASGPVSEVGVGLLLNNGVLSAAQSRTANNAFTCGLGQYLQAVAADGAPTCVTDKDTDTDTLYEAGPGLTLEGTTFVADQRRDAKEAFTCPPGMYLRVVDADGTPTCEPDVDTDTDTNTTYTAGFGLTLSGTTFSAQQGRSAGNAFTCPVGQYLRAAAADGTPTCAPDLDTTYTAGSGISISGGTISAHQSRTAPNAFACAAGQALRVVGADGAPTCTTATYTAGPGLALDGSTFSSAYGATVVPVRGDATPTENGTLLRTAMAGVTGATAEKPYVLALAPGTYELGGTPLTMKPYVSVVGAGRGFTTITGARVSQSGGLVNLGDQTTLAGVTVRNMVPAGTSFVTAIMSNGAVAARLVDVHGYASQEGGETYGLLAFAGGAITVENSQFTVINPTAIGTGIYSIANTTVRARNVEVGHGAVGGWALHAYNNSRIEFADGYANGAVRKGTPDSTVHVSHSKVDGIINGGVQCFGVFTSAMAAATCT